jgi:glycine/D-amino acid oxidase-like deaminating enzyme
MPDVVRAQVLILGGGIAGLWVLARLVRRGVDALLVDTGPLGGGQTVGSQGIIHGGIKYALTGQASAASRAIAGMPERWRACLAGTGEVDLSRAVVLADRQHLWTTPGLLSRVAAAGASKVIRTPVEFVAPSDRPPAFTGAPRGVDVYSVGEPVVDARSIVAALAGAVGGRAGTIGAFELGAGGVLSSPGVRIEAGAIVLAAGAGNADLLGRVGAGDAVMTQLRPLHMVMARFPGRAGDERLRLFGHCLGPSSLPRLTVTTACDGADSVWYLGGSVAETGVERDGPAQIAAAREELRDCLPWLDLAGATFATCRWDRAEALAPGTRPGQRPDEPVVVRVDRGVPIVAAWPTKLALAPLTADRVIEQLERAGVVPGRPDGRAREAALPPARVSPHPWAAEGVRWS